MAKPLTYPAEDLLIRITPTVARSTAPINPLLSVSNLWPSNERSERVAKPSTIYTPTANPSTTSSPFKYLPSLATTLASSSPTP